MFFGYKLTTMTGIDVKNSRVHTSVADKCYFVIHPGINYSNM